MGKIGMKHHHNSENVETLQLVNDANKVFAATDFPSVHQFSPLLDSSQVLNNALFLHFHVVQTP